MTLDGFINLIESIDPGAVRYDAIGQKGDAYTVYSEYRTNLLWADGEICESSVAVQVDYYTRTIRRRRCSLRLLRSMTKSASLTIRILTTKAGTRGTSSRVN